MNNPHQNELRADANEMVADVSADSKLESNNQHLSLNVEDASEDFQKKIHFEMRLGFIRKVYGIISLQLLITVLLCGATFNTEVKMFLIEHTALFWIAMVLSLLLVIPIICFKSITRTVPYNYFILFGWTLCEAYLVACCCALFEPKIVIMAASATFGVTLGITVYAWTTKTDFTFLGGFLFSCLACLILGTIFAFFFPFMHILVCIGGVLLYSLYLLYDTQLIFGKLGLKYSVDDYILAALNIYLDIIQIFLYILEIVARISNN